MDVRRRRGWTRLSAVAVLSLLLAIPLSGCTRSSSPASAGQHTASVAATISAARPSAVIVAGMNPTNAVSTAPSSSSVELKGSFCATAVARAIGAAAALLPNGTSRKPQHTKTCLDGQPLDVTFLATGKLTWTVKLTVTIGTADDCQAGAEGASERCESIEGHPGVIGTSAICASVSCEQAWIFGHGYLVIVQGSVPGTEPRPGGIARDSVDGIAIGVSTVAALTG